MASANFSSTSATSRPLYRRVAIAATLYPLILSFFLTPSLAFISSQHVSQTGLPSPSSTSSWKWKGDGEAVVNTLHHQQHKINSPISNNKSIRRPLLVAASTISDDTLTVENEEETIDNPLKSAGLSFMSASTKSLGMLFYNIGGMDHKEIQALLLEVGTHLVAAGEAWSNDWDAVRDSMASASHAFYDISNVFGSANIDESLPLGTLFEKIGKELEDISEISGCCAVGPPCSAPNLLAVEEHLTEVSIILKKNSVAATDEHMMCTLFKEVAELFGEMAGCYVDNEGQESEVTV